MNVLSAISASIFGVAGLVCFYFSNIFGHVFGIFAGVSFFQAFSIFLVDRFHSPSLGSCVISHVTAQIVNVRKSKISFQLLRKKDTG